MLTSCVCAWRCAFPTLVALRLLLLVAAAAPSQQQDVEANTLPGILNFIPASRSVLHSRYVTTYIKVRIIRNISFYIIFNWAEIYPYTLERA